MFRICFYSLFVYVLLLTSTIELVAQKTYDEFKKELKSLKGSKYVSRSFAAAEILASQGEFENSLDLVERGEKKARGLGSSTHSVVLINKAGLIAREFPKDDKYISVLLESVNKALDKKPPLTLLEKARHVMQQVQHRVSSKMDPEVSKTIKELNKALSNHQAKLLSDTKEKKLKEFEKLDSEEVYDELERLKSERERLESLQNKLAESIDKNEEQLARRSSVINRMTRDQAKKEALLQYNKRMIDSLKFMSELDSINLISHELMINKQESRLELQESMINLKDSELSLKDSKQKLFITLSLLGLAVATFLSWFLYSQRKTNKTLQLKNAQIEEEKERSEELLLNILPKFIAQELKDNSKVQTRLINQCTVLFTDFINFSKISQKLTPQELIAALDECFREFDHIITRFNIEKIKTIGDSYMCAGGVPVANNTHAIDAVNAALAMVSFLDEWNDQREKDNKVRFDARIGIHSGPIIAGVVGVKKFAYDIWGDTVNVASRLEKQSSAQKINISASTYELIKEHYQCIKRGSISVKNMSDLEMYYVDQKLPEASLN